MRCAGGRDYPMRCVVCALAWLSTAIAGCHMLMPAAFLLPETKKVPPEYARLDGRKVLVMVWAEPETLFAYPHIRLELGSYVGDMLRSHLKSLQVTSHRKVEDYMQRNEGITLDPVEVGRHFDVQSVVYVELLKFQVRDPETPNLLQGQADAAIRVYDLTAEADEVTSLELQPVSVSHPEQPVLYTPTGPIVVRNETYTMFAESIAKKFYPHDEKI